jgi:hypothetical protein
MVDQNNAKWKGEHSVYGAYGTDWELAIADLILMELQLDLSGLLRIGYS